MSQHIREAVKQLRLALGKTQTEFGQMIGKGLATIQRYETLVAPKGKTLRELENLSMNSGHVELASGSSVWSPRRPFRICHGRPRLRAIGELIALADAAKAPG